MKSTIVFKGEEWGVFGPEINYGNLMGMRFNHIEDFASKPDHTLVYEVSVYDREDGFNIGAIMRVDGEYKFIGDPRSGGADFNPMYPKVFLSEDEQVDVDEYMSTLPSKEDAFRKSSEIKRKFRRIQVI